MKKTTFLKLGALALLCASLFTACKKDKKKEESNSQKIIGTWKYDFHAYDLNANGSLDESEKNYPVAGEYKISIIKGDGTLIDSASYRGVGTAIPGTWSINGDQFIITIMGTTDSFTVVQLDATRLTIKDHDTPPSWASYLKQ